MTTRDARQLEGVNKAININCTLVYPTGFGKTNTGLLYARRLLKSNPTTTIGVLTLSQINKSQWLDAAKQFNITLNAKTIDEAMNQYNGHSYKVDILIVDEIHKYFTDKRISFINNTIIHYKNILGLTATLPSDRDECKKLNNIAPVLDTITIREAIDNNWIAKHIEINYGLEFKEDDKELYVQLSKPITNTLDLFKGCHKTVALPGINNELSFMRCCTNGYIYKYINPATRMEETKRYHSDQVCYALATMMGWCKTLDTSTERGADIQYNWNPSAIKERCFNFNKIVNRRNDLINNNVVKLNTVLQILSEFTNKTTIVFNQSTEFADKLTTSINIKKVNKAICYHSNIESRYMTDDNGHTICTKGGKPKKFGKTTLKNMAIQGMNDGTYDTLVTVMALDTGMNLPAINLVIITSGTRNGIQHTQRKGRGLRIDELNTDEVVIIFNLYMKSFEYNGAYIKSRDEGKLYERQTYDKSVVIDIDALSDIQYLYKI